LARMAELSLLASAAYCRQGGHQRSIMSMRTKYFFRESQGFREPL
ncbi:unnamed protein product, partial [Mycena citricolor]